MARKNGDKMFQTYIIPFLLGLCFMFHSCKQNDSINLSGEWAYRVDSLDVGTQEKWYGKKFTDKLLLPGTLAQNDIGEEVSKSTEWIGAIIDSSLWFHEKYDRYNNTDHYLVPFWLTPQKYYNGPAWYQKEINIPASWDRKQLLFEFELIHVTSNVWIDSIFLGKKESLATPHRYIIPKGIEAGRHRLTVRVDNSYHIPMGINAHSVSDNTQGNWNGILGKMNIRKISDFYIEEVNVFPDIHKNLARIKLKLSGIKEEFRGTVVFNASSDNTAYKHIIDPVKYDNVIIKPNQQIEFDLPMTEHFLEWNEWQPAVYNLKVDVHNNKARASKNVDFGMREFTVQQTMFKINDKVVFLRGTLECSIFPLEGNPPTNIKEWKRIFSIAKEFGLNHIRFHSWCPPRAAFQAADQLGIYLQVEIGGWATQGLKLGDGEVLDSYIWEESRKIVKEYGNHPSFCMMAYGNEADGDNAEQYLAGFVKYWKNADDRRVYTSSAGWPTTDENQYFSTLQGRIQQWTDKGSTYYIEDNKPSTAFDYENIISNYEGPFVSHEPGQWCAFPDFKEIDDYKGVYKAGNLQLMKNELEHKGMLHQSEDFLIASGKLQALCYKADIEAALRTKGMGGFQLLDLHDFPGQGTAIIGVLNAFWEEKGYISAEEYRQFCDTTVLLAAINSQVLETTDTLTANFEIAHFGELPLSSGEVKWKIVDINNKLFKQGVIEFDKISRGLGNEIGKIELGLGAIIAPAKYTLELFLDDTAVNNKWDFFVFDNSYSSDSRSDGVYVTEIMDRKAEDILQSGGTVWLNLYNTLLPEYSAKTGFTPMYWNSLCFYSQPIHTMGILCEPRHAIFTHFPTDFHTNWQWWDILTHSKAIVMDSINHIDPVLQMIDSYHSNRKLGLLIEAKMGQGKILITGIDFKSNLNDRIASKQLRYSIAEYLKTENFNPVKSLNMKFLRSIMAEQLE